MIKEQSSTQTTEVDVPLYFDGKTILGKARIIEGEGEDAVLIELEATNPKMAVLMKSGLVGISLISVPSEKKVDSDDANART